MVCETLTGLPQGPGAEQDHWDLRKSERQVSVAPHRGQCKLCGSAQRMESKVQIWDHKSEQECEGLQEVWGRKKRRRGLAWGERDEGRGGVEEGEREEAVRG